MALTSISKSNLHHISFLLLCFALFDYTVLYAQDYPDYRSKKDQFTKLQEKDIRSDLATFTMGGIEESVGKEPLKSIPVSGFGKDFISFEENNIKVIIRSAKFESTKHRFTYYDPETKDYILKIDSKPYYGDYGKMPETYVSEVSVIIDRDTIAVPATALIDLCNPILTFNEKGKTKTQNKVFVSADGRKLYVYLLKQESGGSYEATWIIQDKKYVKRVVDFGFLK